MKTIWKYTIEATDLFTLDLPEGAEFLSVHMQHDQPRMWFKVDAPSLQDEYSATPNLQRRSFRVIGTGHEFSDEPALNYLGTFLLRNGTLVFHVFEVV